MIPVVKDHGLNRSLGPRTGRGPLSALAKRSTEVQPEAAKKKDSIDREIRRLESAQRENPPQDWNPKTRSED